MELRTAIVGTKFRGPEAIKVLGEMGQGAVVTLKHEADNEHDENAVAVYGSGCHLGYIPRAHNHALADALKRGATITGRITTEAIIDKGEVRFAPKITVSWGTAPLSAIEQAEDETARAEHGDPARDPALDNSP